MVGKGIARCLTWGNLLRFYYPVASACKLCYCTKECLKGRMVLAPDDHQLSFCKIHWSFASG